MLPCDDADSCQALSGDHSIHDIRGRIELLCIAILVYCILVIQQTQLPSDALPLGSQQVFSSGTTITVMEDYVIKQVDLQKQRHLAEQLSELQKMYKATAGSKHLIQSKGGPCNEALQSCRHDLQLRRSRLSG